MAFEKNVQSMRRMIDDIESVINAYLEEYMMDDISYLYLMVYPDEEASEIVDHPSDYGMTIPLKEMVIMKQNGQYACVTRKQIQLKIMKLYNNYTN